MMGQFSDRQKASLSRNIARYKSQCFPGRGGNNLLARELSVSPQVVSHWIHGRRIPNIYQLYVLARIFDVPIHRLCGLPSKTANDIRTPIDVIIRILQKENDVEHSSLTCIKRQKLLEALKSIVEYEISRSKANL